MGRRTSLLQEVRELPSRPRRIPFGSGRDAGPGTTTQVGGSGDIQKVCEAGGFIDRPDFNRGDNSGVGYFELHKKMGSVGRRRVRSCTR